MNETRERLPEVLVVNCGSSSIKLAWFIGDRVDAIGGTIVENVGGEGCSAKAVWEDHCSEVVLSGAGYADALQSALDALGRLRGQALVPDIVGHRVVHGGERFRDAVLISARVLVGIEACVRLAPLHNPPALAGIRAVESAYPGVRQVAVFDTAFHQTLPPKAFHYAIPHELYEHHRIRRFGMHGTSHEYVAGAAAERLGRPLGELHLLTAHLGNGCSASAVRNGECVDTTMGLTPLEGLVMGTRSGDVDPDLHLFLQRNLGLSLVEISELLNRRSGLLGLSGLSHDMRVLRDAAADGNERAKLAIDVFCYRLAKSLMGLTAGLGRVDAIIFTGGIGEHSAEVRERVCGQLRVLGVEIDAELNCACKPDDQPVISRADSPGPCVMVIPTREEWMIARKTLELLLGKSK